jgi:hypothetical protein
MRCEWGLTAFVFLFAGCGSNDSDEGNGNGPGGLASDARQVCNDFCAAQDAAEMAGNCPGIGLETCRLLCGQLENIDCSAELTELNRCQLTGTFHCGLVSAESDAECTTELQDYQACSSNQQCTGADPDGFCPSVPCACPDGDTQISGIISDGTDCMCADSTTCTEFCF